MKLSTTTDYLGRQYGEAEAIRRLAAAGFDAFDMSLFRLSHDSDLSKEMDKTGVYEMNRPNWRKYVQGLRAVADEVGIVCNQAHAPFPSSVGDPVEDERIFGLIVKAMEIASMMGAEVIVVHPKQHLVYFDEGVPAKLEEMNLEFYGRLIPYCEKFNIKVAVENMWQYDHAAGRIWHSTCSTEAEFCRYVNRLNSPWIVACLDLGHVSLVDGEIPAFIKALGRDRLKALHVHDTDFVSDHHTLPLFDKIDYAAATKALGEIDYTGDLTFEADAFYRMSPLNTTETNTMMMHAVGRELIRRVDAARPQK